MKVLITGGCGFIGSNLVAFHIKRGDEVWVVDDLSTGSENNIAEFKQDPLFRFEQASLLHWPGLTEAVKWADRIYHLAAIVGLFRVLAEPVQVIETNIGSCERLFRIIAETGAKPRILLSSSSSVYGHSRAKILSEDDELIMQPVGNSLSTYSISKLAQEAIALAHFRATKIPVTLLRLFNVIGPRQTGRYGMVVPRFVKQACNNEPITIFGDGKQTRSFCDVRDVINAINLLAEKKESIGEIVNVGNDHELSINELAELVLQRTASCSIVEYIPYEKAYGEQFTDITQRRPKLSKLERLTGFKSQWTLEQTIDNLIELL